MGQILVYGAYACRNRMVGESALGGDKNTIAMSVYKAIKIEGVKSGKGEWK